MAVRRLFLTLLCAFGVFAETKVLENFTLIDGGGGPARARSAMIITDGRIQWVGPQAQLKAPAGAERINVSGKFVMPGIINLHAHLGNTVDLVQDPKFFTRENLEKQLKTYASYGVTSVVSMGSDADLVYQVRAGQRAGRPSLTRIFTAGRGFTGKAGYPSMLPGMQGVPFEVATPAEVAKAVAQLADRKVDIVKIWVDDHLGREKKIPIALCRAIVENAHRHGLKVAAHVFYLEDAKQLVEAGLDGLAHSVRDAPVDDALIAALKKRGAWQAAPTIVREWSTFIYARPGPALSDPFFTRSVSPKLLAALNSTGNQKKIAASPDFHHFPQWFEMAKKNLKRLADAGVKYAFGTDSGPPMRFFGYFEHRELEFMADAGLTPAQIITAATRSAAEFLGVSKDLGTLEAGKWADMIVLGKNPLENVTNTRSLEIVMIAGNRVN
ncbi:MAG: amidohydrolase family protein [Acidobacteriota bacterium]